MFEKLKEMIKQVMPDLDLNNVTEDSRLFDDLGFDSLAIMMLAMNIEDEFNITFDGPMNFITVKDVLNYLEKNN